MTQELRRINAFINPNYKQIIQKEYERRQAIRVQRVIRYGWDPESDCDECGDTGDNVLTGGLCWCQVGEQMSDMRRLAERWPRVVPANFAATDLDSHPNRDAVGQVRFWLKDGYPEGRNLLLTGSVGTGKTGLAIGVMREVYLAGRSVKFDTLPNYLRKLRPVQNGEPEMTVDELCRVRLLVIDDLGTEKLTEWAAEQLITMIDTRSGNHLPTIITTNLPLALPKTPETARIQTVEKLLDERSFSRLVQNIQVTPVKGVDLRRSGRAA